MWDKSNPRLPNKSQISKFLLLKRAQIGQISPFLNSGFFFYSCVSGIHHAKFDADPVNRYWKIAKSISSEYKNKLI